MSSVIGVNGRTSRVTVSFSWAPRRGAKHSTAAAESTLANGSNRFGMATSGGLQGILSRDRRYLHPTPAPRGRPQLLFRIESRVESNEIALKWLDVNQ